MMRNFLFFIFLFFSACIFSCTHTSSGAERNSDSDSGVDGADGDGAWPPAEDSASGFDGVQDTSDTDSGISGRGRRRSRTAEEERSVNETGADIMDVNPAASEAFNAGVLAAGQGNWTVAGRRFEEAVRIEPRLKWGWYNLGLARLRAGDEAGAIDVWQRALNLDPEFAPATINIARTLVNRNRAGEAERMLRESIERHPDILDYRTELARVLVYQGGTARLEAAFSEARQVLVEDERNVEALLVLGEVFFRQDKYELAGWVVERVLALDPQNAEAFRIKGFLHKRQGEKREAFEAFQNAAASGSEHAEMYVNYGVFLTRAMDYDAAVQILEKAVNLAPRMVEARLNLGNAYRGAGRYREALAEYERVRELDSRNTDVILNTALIYLDAPLDGMDRLERLNQAKELFNRFSEAGGRDERLSDFIRDAERAISAEERRIERESIREAENPEEESGTVLGQD